MTSILSMRLIASFALILAVSIAVAADGPDFSGIPGLGGDKHCPNYRCTSGNVPVQKSRAKWSSKGCSAMSNSGMMSLGGASGNEPYASCCDQWHACYQTCGAAKASCDQVFKTCSAAKCGADESCKSQAGISSMMIEIGGCQLYNQQQHQACECVDKGKVEGKRSDVISGFYKKYAPESMNKAPALAKKTDSNGKMAVLFRKLLIKYPAAIKKVKDPTAARYESMMRGHDSDVGKKEASIDSEEDNLDDIWDTETAQEL
mmetsp:Transcript_6510/g.13647  ORF Transcript_6510/g.13647 Transcript_6510/m.13647 type:complete len:260 (-) Transcript_6510:68-847(-)